MRQKIYKTAFALSMGTLIGFGTFIPQAEAGRLWPWHLRYPSFEVFQDDADVVYESDGYDDASIYDEDEYVADPAPRRRRDTSWWIEDSEDLVPSYERPLRKKPVVKQQSKKPSTVRKQTATTSLSKPLTDIAVARAKYGNKAGLKPVSAVAKSKPVAKPSKLQVASVDRSEKLPTKSETKVNGKSIGCTAGAAVVTGYGFGDVKPKACTGGTYAYNAARSGKPYVIKLNAATGEIVDVKRMQ